VKRVGPSVTKTRQPPLVERRLRPLVRCSDYRWRELFENADVLSEGAVRDEAQGPSYYGSTSILLKDRSNGGSYDDADRQSLAELLRIDPHARIRAIRIACLDAQLRAKTGIESIRAELLVSETQRGVCVTVDVEARVVTETDHLATSQHHSSRRRT
jgi:hypothetical protein